MQKRSLSSAILNGKCPRCRNGNIFKRPLHAVLGFSSMHTTCPHCGQKYEVEPGFFFGAMYLSYAFSVALVVAVGVALFVFNVKTVWIYLIAVTISMLILLPWSFRYSRILFLYWFGGINFDPTLTK